MQIHAKRLNYRSHPLRSKTHRNDGGHVYRGQTSVVRVVRGDLELDQHLLVSGTRPHCYLHVRAGDAGVETPRRVQRQDARGPAHGHIRPVLRVQLNKCCHLVCFRVSAHAHAPRRSDVPAIDSLSLRLCLQRHDRRRHICLHSHVQFGQAVTGVTFRFPRETLSLVCACASVYGRACMHVSVCTRTFHYKSPHAARF